MLHVRYRSKHRLIPSVLTWKLSLFFLARSTTHRTQNTGFNVSAFYNQAFQSRPSHCGFRCIQLEIPFSPFLDIAVPVGGRFSEAETLDIADRKPAPVIKKELDKVRLGGNVGSCHWIVV